VRALLEGREPPTIGAIDVAERTLMYGRGGRASYASGGTLLVFVGAIAALAAIRAASTVLLDLRAPNLHLVVDLISLAGLLGLVALAFDVRGIRERVPGFSSSNGGAVATAFALYVAALLVVPAIVGFYALPRAAQPTKQRGGFVSPSQCLAPDCLYITDADNGKQVRTTAGKIVVITVGSAPSDLGSDPTLCDFQDAAGSSVLDAVTCVAPSRPGEPLQDRFRAARAGTARLHLLSSQYPFQVTISVGPPA
jgi:hypothetical protein